MKILLITDNHTPTGGAEKYFFELKRNLKRQSNLHVFSLGFGSKANKGDDYQIIKSTSSSLNKLLGRIFLHPFIYWRLKKAIKHIQPDVIHLHNFKLNSKSLLKAISPYPVVLTVHDYSLICPTAQNIHKNREICGDGFRLSCFWQHHIKHSVIPYLLLSLTFFIMRRQIKKAVNQFIAPSPLLAQYLQKNNFHNVTHISPFKKDVITHSNVKKQARIFLYAGHLGEHKGTSILIEEFAFACQKHPELILKIAGETANSYLHKKIKQLRIEKNVVLLGWQTNLDVLYAESNALIFPSIGLESFGLVMTEAMAHGCAVIGANRGTISWLIKDKYNGLLFDPFKQGDLATKIIQLYRDPTLAKKLGQNGYHHLQLMIDNESALQQILKIYSQAANYNSPANKTSTKLEPQ